MRTGQSSFLFCHLFLAVSAKEDAVVHVFVRLRDPHRELAGGKGSLSVEHSRVKGDMPELPQHSASRS